VDSLSGLLKCECPEGGINKFPTLNFTLENYSLSLPPSFYIDQDQNVCTILIDGVSGIDMWVLGDVFLRYYYTVFDADNKQIGFAIANPVRYNRPKFMDIILISVAIVILCMFGLFIIYLMKYTLARSKNEIMDGLVDKAGRESSELIKTDG